MNSLASCYTMGLHPFAESNVALKKQQLDNFLAGIEKRAFKMAMITLGNRDDALDAVQDAMLQLVAKYHHKDEAEWPKLFFRILRNKTIDMHRKRNYQRRFLSWFNVGKDDENESIDPIERAAGPVSNNPDISNQAGQTLNQLEKAIARLPARQQQAFMLRCWEGFNTAETAATMGCSQGSVKTHYSRAIQALKTSLGEFYEQL